MSKPVSIERARALRKNSTLAERVFWRHITERRLGGFRFRRQHPLGPYVVDFVCLEKRLIVEIDGSQHMEQMKEDETRTVWLRSQGFRVLRFWNNEVLNQTDDVKEVILTALTTGVSPLP
ncbi:MAG: DUF559 domain-containing protein [Dehalococcoidia bacterium]